MNILKSGFTGGVVGWMYGGLPAFYHARKAFIERSHGELFQNRADAVVRAPRRCAGPAHPRSREPRPCPWGGGEDHTGGGAAGVAVGGARGIARRSGDRRTRRRPCPPGAAPPRSPPDVRGRLRRKGPAVRGGRASVGERVEWPRSSKGRVRQRCARAAVLYGLWQTPPPPKTHPRCSLHLRGYVQAAQSPVV